MPSKIEKKVAYTGGGLREENGADEMNRAELTGFLGSRVGMASSLALPDPGEHPLCDQHTPKNTPGGIASSHIKSV